MRTTLSLPYPRKVTYHSAALSAERVLVVVVRGDHFNFVCKAVCGHTTGKLTHSQTIDGLSISKNRPIPRLSTVQREPKLAVLQENHQLPDRIIKMVTSPEVLCIVIMTHLQVVRRKSTPTRRILASKTHPF